MQLHFITGWEILVSSQHAGMMMTMTMTMTMMMMMIMDDGGDDDCFLDLITFSLDLLCFESPKDLL